MMHGILAKRYCKVSLPVTVLHSNAGYYLGTWDEQGPCSRGSAEYWSTEEAAQEALENEEWTQRNHP